MEPEAEIHRIPTRPYDLDALKAQLEEERGNAPAPPDQLWFVGLRGRSVGPLTPAGLEGLRARGQLDAQTLVWRDGWPTWSPAGVVPELRSILGLPGPPGPGEPPTLPQ